MKAFLVIFLVVASGVIYSAAAIEPLGADAPFLDRLLFMCGEISIFFVAFVFLVVCFIRLVPGGSLDTCENTNPEPTHLDWRESVLPHIGSKTEYIIPEYKKHFKKEGYE